MSDDFFDPYGLHENEKPTVSFTNIDGYDEQPAPDHSSRSNSGPRFVIWSVLAGLLLVAAGLGLVLTRGGLGSADIDENTQASDDYDRNETSALVISSGDPEDLPAAPERPESNGPVPDANPLTDEPPATRADIVTDTNADPGSAGTTPTTAPASSASQTAEASTSTTAKQPVETTSTSPEETPRPKTQPAADQDNTGKDGTGKDDTGQSPVTAKEPTDDGTREPVVAEPTSVPQASDSEPPTGRLPGGGDVGGLFYGNPSAGDGTGNSRQFRHSASRRFRSLQSGTVSAMAYNNRVLNMNNINDRVKPGNVWEVCAKADLDEYSCGYTLSNSYSTGNGGLLRVELRTDDGTSNRFPSETVLAKTKTIVPQSTGRFPVLEFDKPVEVKAGQIYHLVFMQLNPAPSECRTGLSVVKAKACPRDKGVVGLNGVIRRGSASPSPFGGEIDATLLRDSATSAWKQDPEELPWYGMRYEDNRWHGQMQAFYRADESGEGGGKRYIQGSDQARQVFTPNAKSYNVDGIWVSTARYSSTSKPLEVSIQQGDRILATSSIAASGVTANCDTRCSGQWAYAKLSTPVRFEKGQTYSAVFSSANGARYSLQSGFPLDYSEYNIGDGGSFWDDAQAEFSSNGGNNWGPYSLVNGNAYYAKRDLSVVFTLVGGPRRLP